MDWRYDYDAITYSVPDLPPGLADLIAAFFKRFGLWFGCFDFALRPDGEAVFLEFTDLPVDRPARSVKAPRAA